MINHRREITLIVINIVLTASTINYYKIINSKILIRIYIKKKRNKLIYI